MRKRRDIIVLLVLIGIACIVAYWYISSFKPQNAASYWTGTVGDAHVRMTYAPIAEKADTSNSSFYGGYIEFDRGPYAGIAYNVRLSFSSGGEMDGEMYGDNERTLATFTTRVFPDIADECAPDNMRCGTWEDTSGKKSFFRIAPSEPFTLQVD